MPKHIQSFHSMVSLRRLRREEKEWDAQVQNLEQKALDITNTNTAITMPSIDTEKIDLKDEEEISQTMKICASQDALLARIDEEFTSNVRQVKWMASKNRMRQECGYGATT